MARGFQPIRRPACRIVEGVMRAGGPAPSSADGTHTIDSIWLHAIRPLDEGGERASVRERGRPASSSRLACRTAFRCRGRPLSRACASPVCPEVRQLAERALAQHTAMTVAAGHGLRRNPDLKSAGCRRSSCGGSAVSRSGRSASAKVAGRRSTGGRTAPIHRGRVTRDPGAPGNSTVTPGGLPRARARQVDTSRESQMSRLWCAVGQFADRLPAFRRR